MGAQPKGVSTLCDQEGLWGHNTILDHSGPAEASRETYSSILEEYVLEESLDYKAGDVHSQG